MKNVTNVLVLGAGGQIAHWVIRLLADSDNVKLTLFLRDAKKLANQAPKKFSHHRRRCARRQSARRCDDRARSGLVNLAGDVDVHMKNIIAAMNAAGVKRIIFVASLGIYDEVPGRFGEWNRREIGPYLVPYRRAADMLEASGLDYTILRPAWLTDKNEESYETTNRDEPFKGTEVSRKSIASLIVDIIRSPKLWTRANIGVDKPGTNGDKPAFL
jgi:uncharacterized protein YbjT (DUF2867 family)